MWKTQDYSAIKNKEKIIDEWVYSNNSGINENSYLNKLINSCMSGLSAFG